VSTSEDRVAARAIALSLDASASVGEIAMALVLVTGDDRPLLADAARRIRIDVADRPSRVVARALRALDVAARPEPTTLKR
jgi:hypothetical protein